jgi:ABC-type sugar transport system ATPase subunit
MSPVWANRAPAAANPILTLANIGKRFAGVHALQDVSIELRGQEIHALVGENGAGKSTLIKIAGGNLRPDSGQIVFRGKEISLYSPAHARALGISVIYQELTVLPHMTVAENIFLGSLPTRGPGFVDWPVLKKNAMRALERLGFTLDLEMPAGHLPIGLQQMVEIAKSLAANADLIIMDEPTSSLSYHEAEKLWEVVRELKRQGKTIVFVSHRLEDVFALAERVTVLRDGHKVATEAVSQLTPDRLVSLMVGRELHETRALTTGPPGQRMLEVRGVSRRGSFSDISFVAHSGEIVGFAGLVGSGRTEAMRAIVGADRPDAGSVTVNATPLELGNPRLAIRAGMGFVPENRKDQALFLQMSVLENIALPGSSRGGLRLIDQAADLRTATEFVNRLNIVTASLNQMVANLSGGNQQKVVLARWLALKPKVLIVDEPTRGIDVGAKAEIHEFLRLLARQGMAIVFVSSELPEILLLSDRILVMRDGRMVAEVKADEANQELVGSYVLGL